MRIVLNSTNDLGWAGEGKPPQRIWAGTTQAGTRIRVMLALIGPADQADHDTLERELLQDLHPATPAA